MLQSSTASLHGGATSDDAAAVVAALHDLRDAQVHAARWGRVSSVSVTVLATVSVLGGLFAAVRAANRRRLGHAG